MTVGHCVHRLCDLLASHATIAVVKMVEAFDEEASINEYGNGFQQSFHAGVSAGFQ